MSHHHSLGIRSSCPARVGGTFALASTLLSLAAAGGAFAQDCFDYSSSMHWIGGLRYAGDGSDIALSGQVAFLTTDAPSVIALDVSDPTAPVLLGSITTSPGPVSIALRGSYAYVSCGTAGIQVVDVSDPTAMQIVGGVTPPGVADGITISGTNAYVAYRLAGISIFDLANPIAPVLLGSFDTPGEARDVAVVGTHAYVADTNSGLRIVNVANPAVPTLLGSVDTPSKALAVRVVGDFAYVGDNFSLQIADVSNPAVPVIAGAVLTDGTASCLAMSGTTAFTSGTDCIKAVDVVNPHAPVVAGSMPDGRFISAIEVIGNVAYVAKGGDMPFSAFDVSSRSTPGPLAVYQPTGTVNTFQVAGIYGYLGMHGAGGGFRVLDLSNPFGPVQVASLAVPNVFDIALDGTRAFVLSDVAGGRVGSINLSDPLHPVQYQSMIPPEFVSCIAVAGSYAYLGCWSGNLLVADCSNPSAMLIVATIPVSLRNLDAVVSGHYLYLASSSQGVYVLDIADPVHPAVVANLPGTLAEGVGLSGHYLLRSLWGSGFAIDDVTDPTAPINVSQLNGAAWANATAIDGTNAYMVGDSNPGGLWVTDFSNPAAPKIVGSAMLPATSEAVTVARGVVYVSCGTEGLVMMPTTCPLNAAGVGNEGPSPSTLELSASAPNPTRDLASVRLSLARPERITSAVFDASGRAVRVLLPSSLLSAGTSELTWDGRDAEGRQMPQGVYFVRVVAGGENKQSKVVLVR